MTNGEFLEESQKYKTVTTIVAKILCLSPNQNFGDRNDTEHSFGDRKWQNCHQNTQSGDKINVPEPARSPK